MEVKKTGCLFEDLIMAAFQMLRAGDREHRSGEFELTRVFGGANNALVFACGDGRTLAIKLCVRDERRRARREWEALRLLREVGLTVAPEAIFMIENDTRLPYDGILYTWLEGDPLSKPIQNFPSAALIESIQQYSRCRATSEVFERLMPAWFHWFNYQVYLDELHGFLGQFQEWLDHSRVDGREIHRRLKILVDICEERVQFSRGSPAKEKIPLCLCHVDPNLANAIFCDGKVRWVDWEYSGWGDPALELSDLRWHASMEDLQLELAEMLRARYQPFQDDAGFYDRLAAWDHILAARWPFLVLRWIFSQEFGEKRQRITQPVVAAGQLWERFYRLLERAEIFYQLN